MPPDDKPPGSSPPPAAAYGWANGIPVTYPTASSPPLPRLSPLPPALAALPSSSSASVHKPPSAVAFPKAFDPDRALLYQRAMSRALPGRSWQAKLVSLAVWLGSAYVTYRLFLVEDYGTNMVVGASWRKARLQRLALTRPLTPAEQAQWDRPWPEDPPPLSDLVKSFRTKYLLRQEELAALRAAYLEKAARSRGESTLASEREAREVDWRRAEREAEQEVERRRGAERVERLPEDVDWGRVGVMGALVGEGAARV